MKSEEGGEAYAPNSRRRCDWDALLSAEQDRLGTLD